MKEPISELIVRVCSATHLQSGQKLAYLAEVFKDHRDELVTEDAFNALQELIKTH